jgi:hypothetical protein
VRSRPRVPRQVPPPTVSLVEIGGYIGTLHTSPATMAEISYALIHSVQHLYFIVAAPALVDRLAGRGLLTRAPGPDRRTNALQLTTAGAREAERALARRHELLGPLVAGLDKAEQQAAAELIGQMLATLVRSGRSPWGICRECDQAACNAGHCQCPVEAARQQVRSRE